ncbi:DUF5317 domain-containing protein [Acidaminobacter hydrogenoformans]|nr:DUF5317 domain-containing protein [Acidaminobacter hydrogenoformans]
MLIETTILGLLIAVVSNRWHHLVENVKIKGVWLPFLAFVVEAGIQIALNRGSDDLRGLIFDYELTLMVLVYSLLVAFFALNLKTPGVAMLLVGVVLNMIVIFSNNGKMPVDIDMAVSYGFTHTAQQLKSGLVFGHSAINAETTKLAFLADILHLRPPYPMPKSVSLGDLVMDVGVLMVFVLNLRENPNALEEEETHVY